MGTLGQLKTSYYFSKHFGPRIQSAGVTFYCDHSDKFVFISKVKLNFIEFEDAIKKGVIDALNEIRFDISSGIRVELIECIENEVESSPLAFYIASKIAIKALIDVKQGFSTKLS